MTPEERERYDGIDRTLEFVSNCQAELAARQAEFSARHEKLSGELDKLKEVTAMHTSQIEAQGKQIGEVSNFLLRLGHIVDEQRTQQARTDERLNALISAVERYVSNGRS